MSHPHSPDLPDFTEPPDVGFVAAVGVYVAVVFVSLSVSVALAVSGTASSVVGSVSTAATVGVVAGALLADGRVGLPERLGRRTRSSSWLFLVPVVFVVVSLLVLVVSSIPDRTVVGTGFGALATLVVTFGLHSMARTRYARAMTPDEPITTVVCLNPRQARIWSGVGVFCTTVPLFWVLLGMDLSRIRVLWALFLFGLFACFFGYSMHRLASRVDGDTGTDIDAPHSSNPRRQLLGAVWPEHQRVSPDSLPELEVHETGLVVKRPLERRFLPWEDVTDVRLTDTELVVERRGWLDLRCARSVIDDPERVFETLERVRSGERVGGRTVNR